MINGKPKLIVVLFVLVGSLFLLSGCNNNEDEQQNEMIELLETLENQELLINELQDNISQLIEQVEENQNDEIELSPRDQMLKNDIIESDINDFFEVFLGSGNRITTKDDITLVMLNFIYVELSEVGSGGANILLEFDIKDDDILWTIIAIDSFYGRLNPPENLERRSCMLTDLQIVSMSFYDNPTAMWDDEAWVAHHEEILGEDLREEVIRLMYEHSRIQIWDLWIEGERLYVDITLASAILFNWGTTGGNIQVERLTRTFSTFPGISEIVFLIGGVDSPGGQHGIIDGIYRLDEGWIRNWD